MEVREERAARGSNHEKRQKNKPAVAGFMHTPCAAGQAGDVAKALFELTV